MELLTEVEAKAERDVNAEVALAAQIPLLVTWLSRRSAGSAAHVSQVRIISPSSLERSCLCLDLQENLSTVIM